LGLLKSIYRLAQIRHMVRLSNAVCIRVVFISILVLSKRGLGLPIDARSNERMATLWCPKQVRGTAARGAPDLPVHRSKEVDRGLNELARFLHVVGMCLPPAEQYNARGAENRCGVALSFNGWATLNVSHQPSSAEPLAPQKACQMAAIIACESDLMGRQGRVALEPLERERVIDPSGPDGRQSRKLNEPVCTVTCYGQVGVPLERASLIRMFLLRIPAKALKYCAWGSKSSPLLEEKTWSEKVASGQKCQKTGFGSQSVAQLPSSRCFSDEANQCALGILGPGHEACKSALTALHSPGVLPPHGPQGDNLAPL